MPLEAGCHAVVRVREDPVMVATVLKRRASNCLPWSLWFAGDSRNEQPRRRRRL